MNKALFFARIREKSLKMEQVARELGISTQALYLRVEGRRNFKMREFLLLIKMLNLTGPQIKEIFFYEQEQEQEQEQKHKPDQEQKHKPDQEQKHKPDQEQKHKPDQE